MRVRLLSLVLTILCLLCSGSFGFSADLIIRDVTRSTGTAMRHIVLEGEMFFLSHDIWMDNLELESTTALGDGILRRAAVRLQR